MYTVAVRTIAMILLFHKGIGHSGQHRVVMDRLEGGASTDWTSNSSLSDVLEGKDFLGRLDMFLFGHCCPH